MKQLVFDTSDAASILDSDNVGAYIRSSDGTQITHTAVSGKQALDVNVAAGINVEVDLSHLDDSVRLGDGTSFFTSTSENSDIALDVHISNTSLVVTANQLDIDNLNPTDDQVQAWAHDGVGTAITSRSEDSGQALDVHITGSGPLTVNDAALADIAILTEEEVLDTANTAQNVVSSILADRKYLFIRNEDNKEMYIGQSGVTAANGFPISPKMVMELRIGPSIDLEFVGKTGVLPTIRTMQLS